MATSSVVIVGKRIRGSRSLSTLGKFSTQEIGECTCTRDIMHVGNEHGVRRIQKTDTDHFLVYAFYYRIQAIGHGSQSISLGKLHPRIHNGIPTEW